VGAGGSDATLGFTPSGSEPVTDDPVAFDFADPARVEGAALDLLSGGIGIFDNDFNLIYANRSFHELRFLPEWLCEGAGLGLSMSHDIIVKQHGASIDVDTEPGKFTEFKIVLPRTGQK
jgi:signal transduction histidine kinase